MKTHLPHLFRKSTFFALFLWLNFASLGQGTNASFVGRVRDAQGETIVGATITVKNESTGFFTGSITNINGEFIIKQLPLGDPYTIKASFIGYGSETFTGFKLSQGDQITVDFTLREESINMQVVEVIGNSMTNRIDQLGSSIAITPLDMKVMPVNGRNFTALTDLSPMSSGSNLSGQLYSSTTYTIDGMSAKSPLSSGTSNRGPYLLSMEAIREFQVVTNDYDVSMGRSGGGSISSVTKSGTNEITGSAFIYHRADQLSSPFDARGTRRSDKYQISQYGASVGGPIIKNRLHYYVTWDHQTDSRPLYIADIQSESDEVRYKISQTTLDRFLHIARSQYGVAETPQTGSFDKKRPSNNVFARIDYQINGTHLLSIRNNFNLDVNTLGISDNSAINLYEVYGTHYTQDNSLLASLRSIIGPKITNEAKFQYLYTKDDGRPNEQLPSQNIPRAIIDNVASVVDGRTYTTTLQIGGQRYLPETFTNNVLQFIDNVYFNTNFANYTFGLDVMYTHLNSKATSEMNGRFYYRGLDAFENNTPYRYVREVPVVDPTVKQGVLSSALYAQAEMTLGKGTNLSFGLRGDYTRYFANPSDNPLLTQELGLKTTHKVAAFQLQPRMQLTWDIGERKKDVIRVGAGIFGSNMNNYAMVNNLEFDGLRVIAFDRTAPNGQSLGITPDFIGYRQDPSSAPGAELFDIFGLPKVATFNINAEDTKIPTVYKYNISYTKFITPKWMVSASFYGTHARNNYMYIDRNMVTTPFFHLSNEDNRGVYVPATSINTNNGNTDWTKGRISNQIGRVLELVSKGKNNTYTAVIDATYRYYKDGKIYASYTWNDAKDNTSYNGNVANSATIAQMIIDDPRDLSQMAYSDNQWRTKIVFFASSPSFYGFNVGLKFSGIAGRRYSMTVNGNINGDFLNGNDLAFVFDPNDAATPQHIRDGINNLLNNPMVEENFKKYVRESFGKVAKRNGGINGFYGLCDLRVSKHFKIYKKHGIELYYDIFNVMNLFDKTKGVSNSLGRQNLYNLAGFDATTNTYKYNVNNGAGVSNPSGNTWQMQLGLRYGF